MGYLPTRQVICTRPWGGLSATEIAACVLFTSIYVVFANDSEIELPFRQAAVFANKLCQQSRKETDHRGSRSSWVRVWQMLSCVTTYSSHCTSTVSCSVKRGMNGANHLNIGSRTRDAISLKWHRPIWQDMARKWSWILSVWQMRGVSGATLTRCCHYEQLEKGLPW